MVPGVSGVGFQVFPVRSAGDCGCLFIGPGEDRRIQLRSPTTASARAWAGRSRHLSCTRPMPGSQHPDRVSAFDWETQTEIR